MSEEKLTFVFKYEPCEVCGTVTKIPISRKMCFSCFLHNWELIADWNTKICGSKIDGNKLDKKVPILTIAMEEEAGMVQR